MSGVGNRLLTAAALTGVAALSIGLGVALSAAQEAKAPDLSDLRDAVKAAGKRGDNVSEIAKALDALDQALAKNFTPPAAGKTSPAPQELAALRNAVEAAARKGENVEDIRKQLEVVEKAITGQVLARPKPLPPPNSDTLPLPNRGAPQPDLFPLPQQLPVFPDLRGGGLGLGGLNNEELQKAQDQMRKAIEAMLKNPNDADAKKAIEDARDAMLKALTGLGGAGGLGGFGGLGGGLMLPDADLFNQALGGGGLGGGGLGGVGRVPGKFRLGVSLERLNPIVVDQLGLEKGQGVAIVSVVEGSAADKAGFKANDIVVEFAGKPVTDEPADFTKQVSDVKAGEKVDAVVLRKGKKIELKGIEMPATPQAAPRRGSPDLRR